MTHNHSNLLCTWDFKVVFHKHLTSSAINISHENLISIEISIENSSLSRPVKYNSNFSNQDG